MFYLTSEMYKIIIHLKMKRNLRHGSGIIHPNYNSNDQMSYTINVIVSGDVQTKDISVRVRNRNAFDM